MTKKSFSALLSKEISGSLSENEREELRQALAENKKLSDVYNQMHTFMHETQSSRSENEINAKLNEVWQKIADASKTQYTFKKPTRRIVPIWARVAASIVLVIGLGLLAYNYLPQQNLYSETLQAGNENLYAVLDDGTQVWLNKNARIAYNKNFGAKSRKIRLTGEAFFDVAHNAAVPLTVSANDVDVTVKGTAFNVNALNNDVEVSLLRGLVGVKDTRQKNAKEVLLHPNQKIVMRDGTALPNDSNYIVLNLVQSNDTIIQETRWLNNALVFNKQKFSGIAKLMEERYNVKIEIEDATLREQQFTGSIGTESLPQMLDALKQSYPFTYEINNNTVIIKE